MKDPALEKTKTIEEMSLEERSVVQKAIDETEFDELVDNQVLYELDPKKVDKTIVINTTEKPFILPRKITNSTIRVLQGERIKGKYYVRLIAQDPKMFAGLALAHKLTADHLQRLEKLRKKNSKEEPSAVVKEIWALKGKTDETELTPSPNRKRQ